MSVQIGEANVVDKIHSMPWLKSPKVSENTESKNVSSEHRDSTNGTPEKEEPCDNNNASNNSLKKKPKRRNSKNRSSQAIQDKKKGERIVKTTSNWADESMTTPQENHTVPLPSAWGSNANTAQALFPQAEDSRVAKKEAEDIDKAIVESVCTMQKEEIQREVVNKNSLEQPPLPQKAESEEDDWDKPKHNLADPPSNTNDNNNNEGKNRNFVTDQFGRVDGHNERHLFMGKGGRRRETEFVKSHTDTRPRQSSQSDYGPQKFGPPSHTSPNRTSARGERFIKKDTRYEDQSHFRGNRNPRQQNRNFGYQGHRNGNYYSSTRDNRNQCNHSRPKDPEPPKIEENPKKPIEEDEPAKPVQIEETKEPPKEEPEMSNSKSDPPAMDHSQTQIDIHHSTPNTTSTPEPLKELENEFHRVNLNTEADYQVQQQPQVPTLPSYSELPYNAAPMQYVDMNSYSQPLYSTQPFGATQTLPHYDYTCTYPGNHHQYSTNLGMANFGLGMVPVVSLPGLDMSPQVDHTQFLSPNEEVLRLQNHVYNLRTQLISAQASLYTAQLKFYQHQAHTRSQPPLNPPTHHHHVPHNSVTSQVSGINPANKFGGIPPGFQKTNTSNFDLPKTYPNLYGNHSSASSEASAHNHPHHSNNGIRNYNNLNHIRGKVNGYTGTEGLTQGRRFQ